LIKIELRPEKVRTCALEGSLILSMIADWLVDE